MADDGGRRLSVEGLEAANAAFYTALEAGDLDAMSDLWAHDDDVHCVHPGAELVVGWPQVRRSWAAVFSGVGGMQLIITDVRARLRTQAGVVSCTENVLTTAAGELGGGRSLATNAFAWDGHAWRMVAHHASPVLRRLG